MKNIILILILSNILLFSKSFELSGNIDKIVYKPEKTKIYIRNGEESFIAFFYINWIPKLKKYKKGDSINLICSKGSKKNGLYSGCKLK